MIRPSDYEKETRKQVEGLDTKMDDLKDDLTKDFHRLEIKVIEAINHLSSRLPYWAVAVIALLTASIGWLLRFKV